MTPINWFEVAAIFGVGVFASTYFFYRRDQKAMRRSTDTFNATEVAEPSVKTVATLGAQQRSHELFVSPDTPLPTKYKADYESGRNDVKHRLSSVTSLFNDNSLSLLVARDFATYLVSAYKQLGSCARGKDADRRKAFYLGILREYSNLRRDININLLKKVDRLIEFEVFRIIEANRQFAVLDLTS